MFGRRNQSSCGTATSRTSAPTWKLIGSILFLSGLIVVLVQQGIAVSSETTDDAKRWATQFLTLDDDLLCVIEREGDFFFWARTSTGLKLGHRIWVTPPEDHRVSWGFNRNGEPIGFVGKGIRVIENSVLTVDGRVVFSVVQEFPTGTSTQEPYTAIVRLGRYETPVQKPSLSDETAENLPVAATCTIDE
jgi:hypothetical protein